METYKIKIEGTSALLMNRFRDSQIEGKTKKRGEAKEEELLRGDFDFLEELQLTLMTRLWILWGVWSSYLLLIYRIWNPQI
jgi:hypothetical protein